MPLPLLSYIYWLNHFKIKLTIVEYSRDKKIGIYVWPTFLHVADTYHIV